MKRKIIAATLGITFGYIATLFSSFVFANGNLTFITTHSFMGEFYNAYLNEAQIGGLMLIIWALIGIISESLARIFDKKEWSILKMTIVHYALVLVSLFPLGILAGWFPLEVGPIIGFVLVFTVIYFFIWLLNKTSAKKSIDEINMKLNAENTQKEQ